MLTVSQGPTHHFFGLENILVTYYVQVPPIEALREREAWMRAITRTHDRIALLVVVDKDAVGPLPGEEFRAGNFEGFVHVGCLVILLRRL